MKVPLLPNGTLLALGELARMMMVVPEENMVVVAFGSGNGVIKCPNETRAEFTWEQSIRITAIWKMVHAAIVEHGDISNRLNGSAANYKPLRYLSSKPTLAAVLSDQNQNKSQNQNTSGNPVLSEHEVGAELAFSPRGGGACYCYCAEEQAIGRCFTAMNESACELSYNDSSVTRTIQNFCPNVTYHFDCFDEILPCRNALGSTSTREGSSNTWRYKPPNKPAHHHISNSMRFDPTWPWHQNCPSPNVTSGYQALRDCHYYPVAYTKCIFVPGQNCVHSPFFPNIEDEMK